MKSACFIQVFGHTIYNYMQPFVYKYIVCQGKIFYFIVISNYKVLKMCIILWHIL